MLRDHTDASKSIYSLATFFLEERERETDRARERVRERARGREGGSDSGFQATGQLVSLARLHDLVGLFKPLELGVSRASFWFSTPVIDSVMTA